MDDKTFNFNDLPNQLNDLDENQLKLIHDELVGFCNGYKWTKNIKDVVNEIFTCRLKESSQRYWSMIKLDQAIKHVKTLPKITVLVDNVPSMVRFFLEHLFKERNYLDDIDDFVVEKCDQEYETGVFRVSILNYNTYLVGIDADYCNLLAYVYREQDILSFVDPSFVWNHAPKAQSVTKEEFCSIANSLEHEFQRASFYRLVLDDNYMSFASDALDEDGIQHCFDGIQEAVEFHVHGHCDDYFYLQVNN